MKGMFRKFKNNKVQLPKPQPPRSLEEINKEMNQDCWELGQLQYQIFVLNKASEEKNSKIQRLNYEGAERKKLDAQTEQDLVGLKGEKNAKT